MEKHHLKTNPGNLKVNEYKGENLDPNAFWAVKGKAMVYYKTNRRGCFSQHPCQHYMDSRQVSCCHHWQTINGKK